MPMPVMARYSSGAAILYDIVPVVRRDGYVACSGQGIAIVMCYWNKRTKYSRQSSSSRKTSGYYMDQNERWFLVTTKSKICGNGRG